jgi:hypothetical protein
LQEITMSHWSRWLPIVGLALAATAARAEFHTWQIEELYSNADGSVQYIVLHESQGMDGESLLQGQVLTSTHLGVTKTYIFPADLPGGSCSMYNGCSPSPTANKRLLIASAGFAALNLVAPNYVMPNGFLPTDSGTVVYGGAPDQVTFSSLPTDGTNALFRSGMVIPNVATNFVGLSASVTAGTVNYQGLWFNPAESGWGINFAHEGDIIFASWFTYDATGKGWWLVMTATKTGPNTYSGTLFQGTGPAFDAVPFPPLGAPGGAMPASVGTGTLTFTDANNASFSYTVNGITQAKAITRQLLGAGSAPLCTFGAQPNLALATNYTALWWAVPPGSESGWGINLTHQGDLIFVTWFTFAHDNTPMWLVGTATKTSPGVYTVTQLGRLTGPPFSATPFPRLGMPGGPVVAIVGSATFTFIDGNTATFMYTVDGVTQTKTITRQVLQNPGTVCQ